MEFKVVYGVIFILLALGFMQSYKSSNSKEFLTNKSKQSNQVQNGSQSESPIVYNINEREIVINELKDSNTGIPRPSTSLNCNCWPLNDEIINKPSSNKRKKMHNKQQIYPHSDDNDTSQHMPNQKGYAKQIHSKDSSTGLIDEKRPKGAQSYELFSNF